MTESARRLIATHTERLRVERELRTWRARTASYELAVSIDGDSDELRKRYDHALGQANGLTNWLTQVRLAEQRLAKRAHVPEEIAS